MRRRCQFNKSLTIICHAVDIFNLENRFLAILKTRGWEKRIERKTEAEIDRLRKKERERERITEQRGKKRKITTKMRKKEEKWDDYLKTDYLKTNDERTDGQKFSTELAPKKVFSDYILQ